MTIPTSSTVVREAQPATGEGPGPAALPGRRLRPLAGLPWLVLIALVLAATAAGQQGLGPTLAYQAYALLAVAIPGLFVKRVLASAATLLEDLGLGFAVGVTGQIALWALHQWLGGPGWIMWAGPAAVVGAALVVPGLRHRVRGAGAAPVWFHWTLAVLTGVGLFPVWQGYLLTPALEQNQNLYQDLWYHLALNQEMLRAFPLESPDAVGVPLTYHWYANAFMAAGHLMTGVDLYSILTRQWLVPMFVGGVLGTVALARRLSDSWQVGWIAVALAYALPGAFVVYASPRAPSPLGFIPESPSNLIGLVMLLAAVTVALGLWQQRARGRGALGPWALLVIVLAGSTGAKPSVLPLLGCVAAGWVITSLFRREDGLLRRHPGGSGPAVRRVPWSGLAVGALAVLATLLSAGIVSDDAQSGSSLQFGGFLRFLAGFGALSGMPGPQTEAGWIHPAILGPERETRAVLVAIGWLLLVHAWHWLPALALPARHLREERAAWALLSGVAGAWAIFSVVDHPGFSEVYFPRTVIPLAAVLAAWVVVQTARLSRTSLVALLVSGAGTVVVVALAWQTSSPLVAKGSHFFDLAKVALVVLVGAVIVWLGQRFTERTAARRAPVVALVLAGVVAASLAPPARSSLTGLVGLVGSGLPTPGPANPDSRLYLTPEELEAAVWLRENAESYDVVASATLCTPATAVAPNCRGDQFWITGISGLRMLLSGWYYLPVGVSSLDGQRGIVPRMELSQKLVADPDDDAILTAREEFGVRWVFADRRTGPVSDQLAQHGTVRFDNGTVQIVELGE